MKPSPVVRPIDPSMARPLGSLLWGVRLGLAALVFTMPAQAETAARKPGGAAVVTSVPSATFQKHARKVIAEMVREFPEYGLRIGQYQHASQVTIPDAARRARSVAFYQRQLAALRRFDPQALDSASRVDWQLMVNQFESRLWHHTTFKAWQWQPSLYNVGGEIGVLLNTEFAPLEKRLRHVIDRLDKVPAVYLAAQRALEGPTLEHTELGILQNKGTLRLLGDDLDRKVADSRLNAVDKARYARCVARARQAVQGYIDFLGVQEVRLRKQGARSFRLGAELYEKKFAHDIQSSFTVDGLRERALAEKAALHQAMEQRARELWPRWMGERPQPADRLDLIRAVLDELSTRHTTPEKFVETIRAQIPALEKFVREKDLVDQDPTRPLVVRETPLYMRGGGAGASISAPGPFDPTAATYYNVTPLDRFTPAQAESFLREYNDWTLQILNIHEAIPGHYTQLMHANKSKSLVKSLFGNGAMIEGWAVFSERVMLEAGYDNGSPEIWLFWMKWNLRSVVNTLIDIDVHTRDLQRDEALRLMQREAFQQETEATEKWRRATLSQVQLTSYFAGYAEILALRDELRARQGDKFSVKGFNNQFLSYGSAPVKMIAGLMRASH